MLILQVESSEKQFTDISDNSDSTIRGDSDYDSDEEEWLREILMEEPFNLEPNQSCSAIVFALENWARNENTERNLTEAEQYLLLRAQKELRTWSDIKGLEWVIDGWKKYYEKQNENENIITIKNDSIKDNKHLIGLLIGVDEKKVMTNVKTFGDTIEYEECKDFSFKLQYQEILENLVMIEDEKLVWKPSEISNFWLSLHLIKQNQFPPQIAIAIKKTCNYYKKFLVKRIHCSGCKVKKEKTSFNLYISKDDLLKQEKDITIDIKYSNNHRTCHHITGDKYGQCRGIIREKLANIKGQPRDIRKEALKNLEDKVKFTGNRRNIPSANTSRTIKSSANTSEEYNLLEKMHVAIIRVNQAEKENYIKKNGIDSLKKRKLMGYIQEPIQTQPLSIVFYNEASLEYYHLYASENPGIFIDYTGQLIKPVPPYLCANYQDNQGKYSKVLNAFVTMASGTGSDAPPIDVLELATNDLTASNLQRYINKFRDDELKIYKSRTVPYLVNCDCGKNILVASLAAYNNETIRQYNERIYNNLIKNEPIDPEKTIIAWCYAHCINAVRNYARSKKFKSEEHNIDKISFSKFAMRIWNKMRVNTTIFDANNEKEIWNWFLNQPSFQLKETNIQFKKNESFLNNFHFDDENFSTENEIDLNENDEDNDENDESNDNTEINSLLTKKWDYKIDDDLLFTILEENKKCILVFPTLNMKIKVVTYDQVHQQVYNPLYNPSLKSYLENTWWSTILFWSDIIPSVKNRTRRTTATVEVENNIVKNMEIKKRNLSVDQYVNIRVESIKSTYSLIAEKLFSAQKR